MNPESEPVFYTQHNLPSPNPELTQFSSPQEENHSNDVGFVLFGLVLVLIPLSFMRTYLEGGEELITVFLIGVLFAGAGMIVAGVIQQAGFLKTQQTVQQYTAATYDNQFERFTIPLTAKDVRLLRFTAVTGLLIAVFELFVYGSSIVEYTLRVVGSW